MSHGARGGDLRDFNRVNKSDGDGQDRESINGASRSATGFQARVRRNAKFAKPERKFAKRAADGKFTGAVRHHEGDGQARSVSEPLQGGALAGAKAAKSVAA